MKVVVLSGKGGAGKTTVATNLAWVLSLQYKVFLIDADVEEPNVHLFLPVNYSFEEKVHIPKPRVNNDVCVKCGKCSEICQFGAINVFKNGVMIFKSLCHGCGACALICPVNAIEEIPEDMGIVKRGDARCGSLKVGMGYLNVGEPSGVVLIKQLKKWMSDEDDVVILDAPPGTSCPVVETLRNTDFALIVAENSPFGLHDLKMVLEMVDEMNIKRGLILNKHTDTYEGVEKYAVDNGIPILMRIPFDMEIASLYSRGILFASRYPQWKAEFERMFSTLGEMTGWSSR